MIVLWGVLPEMVSRSSPLPLDSQWLITAALGGCGVCRVVLLILYFLIWYLGALPWGLVSRVVGILWGSGFYEILG